MRQIVESILPFLTNNEVNILISENMLSQVQLKKGKNLLHEGEVCNHIYFIINGAIRQFGVKDGEEINFLFYFDDDYVFDEPSFYNKSYSKYFFMALENTSLIKFEKSIFEYLKDNHNFSEFLFKLSKMNVLRLYKRNEVLLMNTPEERYLKLLEIHPKIVKKISLVKIASFIGIAGPSLSRIRRRLAKGQLS